MIHRFLDFELDEGCFELRRGGEPIPTQPRVFRLIAHLLHHRERVVTKRELIDTVWEGTLVSETAISQGVMLARKALGDERQELIRTVRGQGFRFVASAEQAAAPERPATPEATPSGTRRPPASSRRRELSELASYVSQAERGHGSLVLIEGDPGIGKSWLMEELAAHVVEEGGQVLWGKVWDERSAPTLWPWIEVLRGLIEPLGGAEAARTLLGPSFEPAFAMLPECGGQRERPRGAGTRETEAEALAERFRCFDAFQRLLRRLCGRAAHTTTSGGLPVRLLVLEDLHTFDETSLQLLQLLSQRLSDLHLLIACTYRNLELPSHKPLAALVSAVPDAAHHLHLDALDESAVRAMLGLRNGGEVPARWVSVVHELASGNPLLVHELARQGFHAATGTRSDWLEGAAFVFPERISSAVRRRTDALTDIAREQLSQAAVLGRTFSLSLLAALLHQSESELLDALRPAFDHDLLRASMRTPGHFSFSQPVVQRAIYHDMPHARRAALHRAAGELLELRPGVDLHELAHHYLLAATVGSREKAITYARLAATEAFERRRFDTAATLYDRVSELSSLEGVGAAALCDLHMLAGDAWYWAGENDRACERLEQAEMLARSGEDAWRRVSAVARIVHVRRTSVLFDSSLQQRLRETFASEPERDGSLGTISLGLRALACDGGAVDDRDALTLRAVARARAAGDELLLSWALHTRLGAIAGLARPSELVAAAGELVEVSRRTSQYELLLDGLVWRLSHAMMLGDLPTLVRDFSEYEAVLARQGSPLNHYMAASMRAAESFMAGSFEHGAQQSLLAVELGARLDPGAALYHSARRLLAHVHYGLGEGMEAELALEQVPPDYRPFWSLAWLRSERRDDARRVVQCYASGGLRQPVVELLRLPTWAVLGEVSAELGELAIVRDIYPLLAPAAGTHLMLHAGVYLGPVSYYLAILAAADGCSERAEAHFSAALDEALAVGALPFLARVRHAYGNWLASRRGSELRGREELLAATHLARGLGMALAS